MMNENDFVETLTRRGMLQQLMDNISDVIYFKDLQGRIVFVNRAYAHRLGYEKPEDVIGKTDFDQFTEEHASGAFADEQRIIATGDPIIGIEEKETWPNGRTTWVSSTKMPLRDGDGNIVGIFGISRDITKHKEHELLIQRMNEQMEAELALAREVQQSFLETPEMHFPKSGHISTPGSMHIFSEYRPSGHIGGDFYCPLPLSETSVGIFVADVMGHGVGAALLMSALNAMVRIESAKTADPVEFLQRLNRRLRRVISREKSVEFITAFYMVVDTANGSIRYCAAGHHSPIVIRAGSHEARELRSPTKFGGPALMFFEDPAFKMSEDVLAPGDRILLFTDGLTEMPSAPGGEDDLELEGLLRLVNGLSSEDLPGLVNDVMRAVLANSGLETFQDDVCLIGIEYRKRDSQSETEVI
jgi:sigma-B regulation protein RsbU (phosphoserine phosphatase)